VLCCSVERPTTTSDLIQSKHIFDGSTGCSDGEDELRAQVLFL